MKKFIVKTSASNLGLAILAGALMAIAFQPINLTMGHFIGLCILGHVIGKENTKQLFLLILLSFWVQFFITLNWIGEAPKIYDENFAWFGYVAMVFLPLILSLFYAINSFLINLSKNAPCRIFLAFAGFALSDIARSELFTGFPWNLAAHAYSNHDIFAQNISIIGIYGLSIVAYFLPFGLMAAYFMVNQIAKKVQIISVFLILAILMIFGITRISDANYNLTNIMVRIVQPNISQQDKWNSHKIIQNLQDTINLSQDDSAELIIWSEMTANFDVFNDIQGREFIASALKNNQYLITGGFKQIAQQMFNSLIVLDNQGKIINDYSKSHLVPFGEYVPFGKYLPLQAIAADNIDFSRGEAPKTIKIHNLSVIPLICYEGIFPDLIANTDYDNADAIINITNDAWFGHGAGPYQHLEIVRLRAIESGLPLIRVAGTGISAIIDPFGRIIDKIDYNTKQAINSFIPQKIPAPFYILHAKLIFWLEIIVLLGIILGIIISNKFKR